MSTSLCRRSITLFALVTSFCTGGAALGSEPLDHEIPTQLINTPDVDDLNGACSKCRVASLAAAQTATEDGATVELYYADERGSLRGVVALTILLADGTYQLETIEDVELVNEQVVCFELGPRAAWSWRDDVRHVWVEVVPSAAKRATMGDARADAGRGVDRVVGARARLWAWRGGG
jgi:hypothetical protein